MDDDDDDDDDDCRGWRMTIGKANAVVVVIGMLQSDVDIHTNNAAFPNSLMIIVYSVLAIVCD
jgi:hypothetical protein